MRAGIGGAAAPLFFADIFGAYLSTDSKTLRHPSVLTGDVLMLVVVGQSNAVNIVETTNTTVNTTKVHNLNIYDGGLYNGQAPLLGCGGSGGTWMTQLADLLVTAGTYDHVVIVPLGVGSTFMSYWAPVSAANPYPPISNGRLFEKTLVALRRCDALGRPATAVITQIGESDNTGGTTAAAFMSRLQEMVDGIERAGYPTLPILIGKSTRMPDPYLASSGLRAAVDAVVAGNANVYAGADTDDLGTPYRQPGDVHFNATASPIVAARWKIAIEAAL